MSKDKIDIEFKTTSQGYSFLLNKRKGCFDTEEGNNSSHMKLNALFEFHKTVLFTQTSVDAV